MLRYVADKAFLKYLPFQLWNRDHASEAVGLQRVVGGGKSGVIAPAFNC